MTGVNAEELIEDLERDIKDFLIDIDKIIFWREPRHKTAVTESKPVTTVSHYVATTKSAARESRPESTVSRTVATGVATPVYGWGSVYNTPMPPKTVKQTVIHTNPVIIPKKTIKQKTTAVEPVKTVTHTYIPPIIKRQVTVTKPTVSYTAPHTTYNKPAYTSTTKPKSTIKETLNYSPMNSYTYSPNFGYSYGYGFSAPSLTANKSVKKQYVPPWIRRW